MGFMATSFTSATRDGAELWLPLGSLLISPVTFSADIRAQLLQCFANLGKGGRGRRPRALKRALFIHGRCCTAAAAAAAAK